MRFSKKRFSKNGFPKTVSSDFSTIFKAFCHVMSNLMYSYIVLTVFHFTDLPCLASPAKCLWAVQNAQLMDLGWRGPVLPTMGQCLQHLRVLQVLSHGFCKPHEASHTTCWAPPWWELCAWFSKLSFCVFSWSVQKMFMSSYWNITGQVASLNYYVFNPQIAHERQIVRLCSKTAWW